MHFRFNSLSRPCQFCCIRHLCSAGISIRFREAGSDEYTTPMTRTVHDICYFCHRCHIMNKVMNCSLLNVARDKWIMSTICIYIYIYIKPLFHVSCQLYSDSENSTSVLVAGRLVWDWWQRKCGPGQGTFCQA